MQWYYALSGRQHGPVSLDELQKLATSGQVRADTLVWKVGMPNWIPASQVPDITLPTTTPSFGPVLPPIVSPYAPPSPNPATGNAYPPAGETVSNTGPLVISIVATLISLFLCCIPFGAIGIVFAAMIPGKVRSGDIQGAKTFVKLAYGFSIGSIVVALAYLAVQIALFATAAAGGL